MNNPLDIIIEAMEAFAPAFVREKTWKKAKLLVLGVVLTQGRRVVTGALRTVGLANTPDFNQYHHVLSRAVWSPLALAQILLEMLVSAFFQENEPLVFGIDETIERRWGTKIKARGIYRDAVRSSGSHFVKASGLRWISVMMLTPLDWAQRRWALPVLTILAPSAGYYERQQRQAKTLLERALQLLKVLKRWLAHRDVVAVGDANYAALDFLAGCQQLGVTFITRLRLDAALYDPAPPYAGRGRPRKKGERQPTLQARLADPATPWQSGSLSWYGGQPRTMSMSTGTAVWYSSGKTVVPLRWVLICDPTGNHAPLALLCTDDQRDARWIAECFVTRWQVEVTFQEARRHLGFASQRQWSDNAIARTTPLLLGLFSWLTLVAHRLHQHGYPIPVRQSAWYTKALPTFSDVLAHVRRYLWLQPESFYTSTSPPDMQKVPIPYLDALLDTASYAA